MKSSYWLGFALVLAACGGSAVTSVDDGKQPVAADGDGDGNHGKATAPPDGSTPAEPACKENDERECGNPNSLQRCTKDEDGALAWGPCEGAAQGSSTPLVLVFDDAPVEFHEAKIRTTFDLAGDGASHVMSWPTARTPWLALDRDGNGRIDAGSELFGSMTRLASGVRAKNGFEALAELDSNHDGAITADDEGFSRLLLWADSNGDRDATSSEQRPASESIVRVELAFRNERRCTSGGDCEIERATFVYRNPIGELRTGEVVDVHLRHR